MNLKYLSKSYGCVIKGVLYVGNIPKFLVKIEFVQKKLLQRNLGSSISYNDSSLLKEKKKLYIYLYYLAANGDDLAS